MSDLGSVDWGLILENISGRATSNSAREKLLTMGPLKNETEAKISFDEIVQASAVLLSGVRPFMQSLDLYSTWITRLRKRALLKTLEIKDIRHFCLEVLALDETLKLITNTWATDIQGQLMDAERPLSAIDQVMTANGDIRADASEKLYRLHNEKEKIAREVQKTLDTLVKDHQMETFLQEKYVTTREGRWVIPVKGGSQHFVPGVIHGSSQTKQTVFMEPEKVIPMNNRLRQVEVEIEDEIERILTELSGYLSSLSDDFDNSRNLLELCDMRFAQSQWTLQVKGEPCEFAENIISLVEARHPLLELAGKKVIGNTVTLDPQKSILILSGPNAGGKTVLLKSIGLAAQMARCGLPPCVGPGSKLPFFKNVVVGIGDSQSVDEDLSTFAAHLKLLAECAKAKGFDNLLLIDEICGSTDPEEGAALAKSFIRTFAGNQVFGVITSHLGFLKSGWRNDEPIVNGSLEYDSRSSRPTYNFLQGVPGDSLALLTAERVGIDQNIIERAKEFLSPAKRAQIDELRKIEDLRRDVIGLQDHLRKEQSEVQKMKSKYEVMVSTFEKEKEKWLSKATKKAEARVEEAIAQAKVDDVFKKHRNLQEIRHQMPEIIKATPTQTPALETAKDFGERFPPGTKVFIPSLGQDGIIQSTPNAKGEVSVLSQSIRLSMPWFDLKPPTQAQNPTSQIMRSRGHKFSMSPFEEDMVVDLRGKNVDVAVGELEIALDKATARQEDRIKIVHGHGTEALKRSIRTYLSRSVYVKKWKAGTPDSGGDGITWAELGNQEDS